MRSGIFGFLIVHYHPDVYGEICLNIGAICWNEQPPHQPVQVRFLKDWSRVIASNPHGDIESLALLEKELAEQLLNAGDQLQSLLATYEERLSNAISLSPRGMIEAENIAAALTVLWDRYLGEESAGTGATN